MSDARETILRRVRGALAPLKERASYPAYADDVATVHQVLDGRDPVAVFAERLKLINGLAFDSAATVAAWLKEKGWTRGYCDPALWPELAPAFGPEFRVETTFDRARVDDYQFGITRAAGAIAEIGAIILKDESTSTRLGALAPWVHVAVVRRGDVLASVAQATQAFGDDPNVIWCAGPSKTADIEGILIEGVHGPGQQIALVL